MSVSMDRCLYDPSKTPILVIAAWLCIHIGRQLPGAFVQTASATADASGNPFADKSIGTHTCRYACRM